MLKTVLRTLLASAALALTFGSTAQASGWIWATYLPATTVSQLANRYSSTADVVQAAAAVESQGYGCANIQGPNGWVWSSMTCAPHGSNANTPLWGNGNWGQAIAMNNCYCTQRLGGAFQIWGANA